MNITMDEMLAMTRKLGDLEPVVRQMKEAEKESKRDNRVFAKLVKENKALVEKLERAELTNQRMHRLLDEARAEMGEVKSRLMESDAKIQMFEREALNARDDAKRILKWLLDPKEIAAVYGVSAQ